MITARAGQAASHASCTALSSVLRAAAAIAAAIRPALDFTRRRQRESANQLLRSTRALRGYSLESSVAVTHTRCHGVSVVNLKPWMFCRERSDRAITLHWSPSHDGVDLPGPRCEHGCEMAGSGRCDQRQRGFGGWPPPNSGRLLGLGRSYRVIHSGFVLFAQVAHGSSWNMIVFTCIGNARKPDVVSR